MGDHLQGLAESHVIGQHAADAGFGQRVQPAQAFALIRAQLDGESGRHRVAGTRGRIVQTCGEAAQSLRRLQLAAAGQRLGQLVQPPGLHAWQMQMLPGLVQIFGQGCEQPAQFLQAHRHASPRIHRRVPHCVLGFVRRRLQAELMLGQGLRHRRQQIVALPVQLDADFQIEGVVVGIFSRLAIPAHRTFQHFERKARRIFKLEPFGLQLRTQGQPARGRVHLERAGMPLAGEKPGILGQSVGQIPRQALGVHGRSQTGAFELFHRREFLGAATRDFHQSTLPHAAHQRIAAAAGQAFACVVEGQPRIGQRRCADGETCMPGQRMQHE